MRVRWSVSAVSIPFEALHWRALTPAVHPYGHVHVEETRKYFFDTLRITSEDVFSKSPFPHHSFCLKPGTSRQLFKNGSFVSKFLKNSQPLQVW